MSGRNLSPRRTSSRLDQRLADLDARLQQMRAENDALKGRLSPASKARSPSASQTPALSTAASSVPPPSRNIAFGESRMSPPRPASPPSNTYQRDLRPTFTASTAAASRVGTSGAESAERSRGGGSDNASPAPGSHTADAKYNSPSYDRSQRRLREMAQEDEDAKAKQRAVTEGLDSHVSRMQERLTATNREIAAKEKDADEVERRKARALTDTARQLEASDARLEELERTSSRNQQAIADLKLRRQQLERQVEETRLAVRRAEGRSDEVLKEQMGLERRLLEAAAATKERERALQEEGENFAQVRQRLDERIQELEEECHTAADRLRRLESQHKAQEGSWKDEESALVRELESVESHVVEQQARLATLQAEVADREKESDVQRALRERRTEEVAREREAERIADAERAQRALEQRERELLKEREDLLSGLHHQIDALNQQLEQKSKAKVAQEEVVAGLEKQLTAAQHEAARKEALAEECAGLEDAVQDSLAKRDELQGRARDLHEQLRQKDEELADLDRAAKRLASKLDEEKRLRSHVNEIAAEVNDAQLRYESEKATHEQSVNDLEAKQRRVRDELAAAENDVARIRETGTADLEALQRKITALKTEVAEKESTLQAATRANAERQAVIAEFEEEKRRMEREALARKAAAAHAAKAALTELSF